MNLHLESFLQMNTVPVISSTLSPMYLNTFIKLQYGFSDHTSCAIFRRGINHTYYVEHKNNKYVFRVYSLKWRSETEIQEELNLLIQLKEDGFSVSYPIEDQQYSYIQTLNAPEGPRFAVLFSYAKGEIIRNPTPNVCHVLGQQMAKFHTYTLGKQLRRIDYNASSLSTWAYTLAKNHFSAELEEIKYVQRANELLLSLFDRINKDKTRFGIVHLDMWYDNMKIDNDLTITIFDFDNCGNGGLFLDIGYTAMLLFRHEPDKVAYATKINEFYAGYQKLTRISDEEFKLIPYAGLAIWIHYMGIHVQRFDDWSNVFLSKDFLKYWINTVKSWMEYNGIDI